MTLPSLLFHCPKKEHVRLLSTVRGQISDIRYFSVQACGKYFGFSLCPAEPIFYSPDVLSRIGGVAIGLAGRDHFNTRSRYKFRSRPPPCGGLIKDRRGSNWPKSCPDSSRSRTNCHRRTLPLSNCPKWPQSPRFNRQSFSAPISSFCPAAPLLFTSYRNSLLFTPLSALGCDFCGTVREIWRNPISDLAKSIPRLEIQRLVPRKRLAVPPPPPSLPPP